MPKWFRTFVTSAIQVVAPLMTWIGRLKLRIVDPDRIHKTEKGVKHLKDHVRGPVSL